MLNPFEQSLNDTIGLALLYARWGVNREAAEAALAALAVPPEFRALALKAFDDATNPEPACRPRT